MEPRRDRRGFEGHASETYYRTEGLQWSLGVIAEDSLRSPARLHPPRHASMEPRRDRRGFVPYPLEVLAEALAASMEPRRDRRGFSFGWRRRRGRSAGFNGASA